MPYGRYRSRRNFRSRRYRSRRPRYTTTGSALHLAKQAARGVYYLKGLVNSELKKFDSSGTGNLSNTGTVQPLHAISQGDEQDERNGNSIFVRAFDCRFLFQRDPAAAGANAIQQCRVSLVMDTQQQGDTSPSYSDIYDGNGPRTHLNKDTVGRFKVLWSRTFILDNDSKFSRQMAVYKKMRHHIRYNGTGANDIQKGGLYLVFSSDQATSDFPAYAIDFRLSYHDN